MIKSRRMKWAGHVARMREEESAYADSEGKLKGNRQLGRLRNKCKGIKMDFNST
jgi:hypothetical protein